MTKSIATRVGDLEKEVREIQKARAEEGKELRKIAKLLEDALERLEGK